MSAVAKVQTPVERFFEINSLDLAQDAVSIQTDGYQAHFKRSREAIDAAIAGLSGTALILGIGCGNDIPLAKLLSHFDRLILVDVDFSSMRKWLEATDVSLQEKVQVELLDLTGVFLSFSEGVDRLAKKALSYNEFIVAVLDLLKTLKPESVQFEKFRSSFVCSSLLCSQLSVTLEKYLTQVCRQSYGKCLTLNKEQYKSFREWQLGIEITHLNNLSKFVTSDGKIYFADHFSVKNVQLIHSATTESESVESTDFFYGVLKIQKVIQERFTVSTKNSWSWSIPGKTVTEYLETEDQFGGVRLMPMNLMMRRDFQISSYTMAVNSKN